MTNLNEADRLRARIAAEIAKSSETVAGRRSIALDVSRGELAARAQYEAFCKAQAGVELELEILHFALDALSSSVQPDVAPRSTDDPATNQSST